MWSKELALELEEKGYDWLKSEVVESQKSKVERLYNLGLKYFIKPLNNFDISVTVSNSFSNSCFVI